MAIRDGVPNFELVGMIFAVAGERFEYLAPEEDTDNSNPDMVRQYDGDIYVNTTRTIIYGITYALSIESIEEFLENNKDVFISKGYDYDQILKSKTDADKDKEQEFRDFEPENEN